MVFFFYIYILQLCSPKLTQVLSKFTSIWYYQVWLSQIIPLIWNSTFAFKTHFKGVCTLTEPLQMVVSWKRPCSRNRSSKESYRANQPYSKYQLHRAVKVTAIPDANIIEEKLVRLGNMGEASSHSIKLKHILCSISFYCSRVHKWPHGDPRTVAAFFGILPKPIDILVLYIVNCMLPILGIPHYLCRIFSIAYFIW